MFALEKDSHQSFKKVRIWVILVVIAAIIMRFFGIFHHLITPEAPLLLELASPFTNNIQAPLIPSIIFFPFELMGGLIVARVFTFVLGLVSVYFFYRFSLSLLVHKTAAIFSVALLLIQSSHIYISSYATHDILAFTFFTGFLWFFADVFYQKNEKISTTILASVFFSFAVLSNLYLLILPFFAIFIALASFPKRGVLFSLISVLLITIFLFLQSDYVSEFLRHFILIENRFSLTEAGIQFVQYFILPGILFYSAFSNRHKTGLSKKFYVLVSFISIFLLLYILFIQDSFAFHWLMIYPIIVLLAPSGAILKEFIRMGTMNRLPVVLYLIAGVVAAWFLAPYKIYPDQTIMLEYTKSLKNKLPDKFMKIAADEPTIIKYYYKDFIPQDRIVGIDELKDKYAGSLPADEVLFKNAYPVFIRNKYKNQEKDVFTNSKLIDHYYKMYYKEDALVYSHLKPQLALFYVLKIDVQ